MSKTAKKILVALVSLIVILVIALAVLRGLFPVKYEDTVEKYCNEYSVDTTLVYALIKAESNYNKNASSHAGAKGLMQLTDSTFEYCKKELGITNGDILDPDINIRAGIWYLSYLLEKYHGNVTNAVAAYNAGETNVDKWLSDSRYSSDGETLDKIPFGETNRHVEKIENYIIVYEFIYPELNI